MTNTLTTRGAVGAVLAASVIACAQTSEVRSGYAPVNGLKMYYEMHGTGHPLILIHGGLGMTGMFSEIMPVLSGNREVIAVDLQGHGRTGDIDRPMSFDASADDIVALMHYLKIEKADVMGYSLGGGVALRTAIEHPEAVRRLVVVSAPFKRDGWYPEIIAGMTSFDARTAEQLKKTPMYQAYEQVAPRPADWPEFVTKLGVWARQDYDWSSDVAKMKLPVLLVFGDADAVRTAHAEQFFELLGGGKRDGGWDGSGRSNARLAILPGLTHYTIFSSPLLVSVVTQFLDAPMQQPQ
jgi:pimeloyl-ACP methyl ester carboxylesterase